MKSAGLVQIFRPIDKERAEKVRQDGVAEFISASPYSPIYYSTGFSIGKEDSNISINFPQKDRFHILTTNWSSCICQVLQVIFFYDIIMDKKVSLRCAYALAMSNLQIFQGIRIDSGECDTPPEDAVVGLRVPTCFTQV